MLSRYHVIRAIIVVIAQYAGYVSSCLVKVGHALSQLFMLSGHVVMLSRCHVIHAGHVENISIMLIDVTMSFIVVIMLP
jgi:ABC-type transporter Mla maintaining outer membrane lipid asymmetry ATPase subunit MlaF